MSQVAQSLTISANKFKMSGQTAQAYKARISELNNGMKQRNLLFKIYQDSMTLLKTIRCYKPSTT